ncbi:hypothetical protein [Vibrio phage J14]|nr:hypothetical protein [Vibrio phage J14]
MSEIRRALIGQSAPHGQKYSFVRETQMPIPHRGDGYAQEWKLTTQRRILIYLQHYQQRGVNLMSKG